jgi:hypothetical protein
MTIRGTIGRFPPLLAALAGLLAAGCGVPRSTAPASAPTAAAAPRPTPAAAPRPAARVPREITFDDIKLDMQKGDPFTRDLLPERVTALEREPVRIRGYILPSFQQTGLTQFVLVRDNQECCFGPGAALHDCIVVRMRPGKTADFSIRPVAVAGTFRVDELKGPDGKHLAIYALDGDAVE